MKNKCPSVRSAGKVLSGTTPADTVTFSDQVLLLLVRRSLNWMLRSASLVTVGPCPPMPEITEGCNEGNVLRECAKDEETQDRSWSKAGARIDRANGGILRWLELRSMIIYKKTVVLKSQQPAWLFISAHLGASSL